MPTNVNGPCASIHSHVVWRFFPPHLPLRGSRGVYDGLNRKRPEFHHFAIALKQIVAPRRLGIRKEASTAGGLNPGIEPSCPEQWQPKDFTQGLQLTIGGKQRLPH